MLYQASNSNSTGPHSKSRFSRLVWIVMFKHSDWLQITQRLIQINSNDPLVNLLHTFLVSEVAAFSDNFTRRAGCLCPRSTLIRTLLSLSLSLTLPTILSQCSIFSSEVMQRNYQSVWLEHISPLRRVRSTRNISLASPLFLLFLTLSPSQYRSWAGTVDEQLDGTEQQQQRWNFFDTKKGSLDKF